MHRLLWTGLIISLGVLWESWSVPTQAQTIPPLPTPPALVDAGCRGCHGDNTDALTLPSGESLLLAVDLAALNASPHSAQDEPSAPCVSCHVNDTAYRYPHQSNPAPDAHTFRVNVAQRCQECHYPHLPFHENVDATQNVVPTCIDCHGSHDIVRVEEMAEAMPARCVQCHTDRSRDWVADFLEPRPGIGHGAEGYAGSMRCAGCHEEKYFTWRDTLHANIIQNPASKPEAIVADFMVTDDDLTFTPAEVAYTIGSRWKQLFITTTVSNTLAILPAQWNVATQEWVAYHPETWATSDWRKECAGCHVTGLETTSYTFTEFGVGCESCHGPGAAHAADPEHVDLFADADDQVCGACHSRGLAPDGHAFPTTYRPGDALVEHFTFVNDAVSVWPDGSARLNHQQYMDWRLGSTMQQASDMHCTTCHNVHEAGPGPSQLKDEETALCLSCHAPQAASVKHTPFHEAALRTRDFACSACHMPLMAISAVEYDIHNHSLLQPNPVGTIEHGGLAAMPNACNRCHSRPGEDPTWAAQTIAFAKQQAPPMSGGFFAPGPTPTSPPPPTPLAVVGQPPVVVQQIEARVWVRWGVYVLAGVLGLLVVAWGTYRIQLRRERDA